MSAQSYCCGVFSEGSGHKTPTNTYLDIQQFLYWYNNTDIVFFIHFSFHFVSDCRESEERPIRRDWDSVKIRTAPKYYYPEGCKCNTHTTCQDDGQNFFNILITFVKSFNKPHVACVFTIRCLTTASASSWFRTYWEEKSCWTELWGFQILQREMRQTSSAHWPKLWSIYTHRG